MLSTLLHKHLDEMDAIEAEVKAEVDKIIANMDPQKLIADPQWEMANVIEEIRALLVDKFMALASKNGFDLAKAVSNKDVLVDPAKDPTKNQGVAQ